MADGTDLSILPGASEEFEIISFYDSFLNCVLSNIAGMSIQILFYFKCVAISPGYFNCYIVTYFDCKELNRLFSTN